ncbi:MAG TPA: class I SAM-dependent methyltransferase [Terracidiphilus sp.]
MEEEWGFVRLAQRFMIPLAQNHRWIRFCEIGASKGETADEMLKLPNISYTIIDPCFDADLALKYVDDKRVTVLKGNSLDVLPKLEGVFDCILIDGDHNWYTVLNELRLIRQSSMIRRGGMIFFHDVGWPYGRRDLYYQPETIPPQYRQQCERKGIMRGRSQLVDSGGTNESLWNCVCEGGPKNGVLTAIEDFIQENPSDYNFCRVRFEFGLGMLQYRSNRLSEELSFKLLQTKAALWSLYGFLPARLVGRFKKTPLGRAVKQKFHAIRA